MTKEVEHPLVAKVSKEEEEEVQQPVLPDGAWDWKALWVSMGLILSSLIFSVSQQAIIATPGFKPLYLEFLTCVHVVAYSIISILELQVEPGGRNRAVPMRHYMILAVALYSSVLVSNFSLRFVSYSTRLLFKCLKPVSTMLLSVLMLKRRYSMAEYGAVSLLCMSVFMLTAGDLSWSKEPKEHNEIFRGLNYGFPLLLIAAFSDSFVGTYEQWQIFSKYDVHPAEIVLYSYVLSSLMGIAMFLASGKIFYAVDFFTRQNPMMALWLPLSEICGYCSVRMVLYLLQTLGATDAEVVKTVRKGVVYIVTHTLDRKPLNATHFAGAALLALSTSFSIQAKELARALRG